jgi:DNA-binding beta-propeller fold protein YncE
MQRSFLRRPGWRVRPLTVVLLLGTLCSAANGQASPALELKTQIVLPDVGGRRLDHIGVDVGGQRLFVTAFHNHTVEVVDVRMGKLVRTLSNLGEPQGALYEPSTNRLYISSSADGTVKIFDGGTFEMLSTVKFSSDADNLRYDPHSKSVVVGYGGEKFLRGAPIRGHGDGALAFLDDAGKKTGEIALDAHPESFQIEKNGTRVFVNVPDHREIEVADVVRRTVLARWPETTCTENFPMSLDEAHHRLFVGCRTPARLLVFDTESGKMIAAYPTVEHTDDLFYDPARGRVYVLGESFIESWQQRDADHYDNAGRVATPAEARTGLFVPQWGRVFEAVPKRGGEEAEVLVFETK